MRWVVICRRPARTAWWDWNSPSWSASRRATVGWSRSASSSAGKASRSLPPARPRAGRCSPGGRGAGPGGPRTRCGHGHPQGHQRVAGADRAARLDVDGADDPALEVLDGLALAFRADHAGGHGSAGQRNQPGPGAAATEEDEDHRPAEQPLVSRCGPQAEVAPAVLRSAPRAAAEDEAGDRQHCRQRCQAQQPLARRRSRKGRSRGFLRKVGGRGARPASPTSPVRLARHRHTLARRAARAASTSLRGPKAATSPPRSIDRQSIRRRCSEHGG